MSEIGARLAAVHAAMTSSTLHLAARPHVELVAVSKTHPAVAVEEALAAGQRRFGENRVQEAATKFLKLREAWSDLLLHLIGPLQTNKAREAVRVANVVESLDRFRLLDALADAVQREGRTPELLVQVNIGREPQKAGVLPEDADAFIATARARFGDAVRGLMAIPPAEGDPAPHFQALVEIADRHGLPVRSIGMSGDFAAAIRHGSTRVRVGSAIFGAR